jgi:single-strand DNA-binding protein
MVLVEGRLIPDPKTGGPRIWEGQNGPGASFEVSASTVRFLSSRQQDDEYASPSSSYGSDNTVSEPEDIPF